MYSDISIHTNDSVIQIPKKLLKKTYIRAEAEKHAEIIKRQALEKEYNKIIDMKKKESEKVSYLEKNMSELKKEIDEYKSCSSNNKIKIENLSESSNESSNESSSESSNQSSSESHNESSSENISENINMIELDKKKMINKMKEFNLIIKENKQKLADEYYKKHYAPKIEMLKKGLITN
jgi:hypothetical protein